MVKRIPRKRTKQEDYDDEDEDDEDDYDEEIDEDDEDENDEDENEEYGELKPSWMEKIEKRQKKLYQRMNHLEKVDIQDKITNGINQALQEIGLATLKPKKSILRNRQKENVVDHEKQNKRPLVLRRKK